MNIRPATIADVCGWANMRALLWPETTPDTHLQEVRQLLLDLDAARLHLVAETEDGTLLGFAEAGLRHDYVNGCETSPVLFLEGLFVAAPYRRKGVARRLCDAVAVWGKMRGCSEFASDALLDNEASHAFHAAVGFHETDRVVYFHKTLP